MLLSNVKEPLRRDTVEILLDEKYENMLSYVFFDVPVNGIGAGWSSISYQKPEQWVMKSTQAVRTVIAFKDWGADLLKNREIAMLAVKIIGGSRIVRDNGFLDAPKSAACGVNIAGNMIVWNPDKSRYEPHMMGWRPVPMGFCTWNELAHIGFSKFLDSISRDRDAVRQYLDAYRYAK